ncbi:carotenoid oxygenase family protein [Streptomyces mirabilis]|uniref:carotenoid oxygenase family protein n=1 Tax=Streptomyces mirabilis TaxID=68239 RepID=UPI00364160FF
MREPGHSQASSVLHRWTLDPATGRASESPLDDRDVEFPTHNETLTGSANRYLYTVSGAGIAKHDLTRHTSHAYETPGSRYAGTYGIPRPWEPGLRAVVRNAARRRLRVARETPGLDGLDHLVFPEPPR